ncbi:hypothetical protein H1P_2700009 [Hyella patelloides LEGE 07179]|uniref:Uncharacterized protein n=1 Tax=Hyella patelloides LEGE 07179 TaxID=945734 RepID=A0A563VSW9_9CYAN|nr:hypothetical protein H1P_2700009 [Hyella patelloides LEGE 07179]
MVNKITLFILQQNSRIISNLFYVLQIFVYNLRDKEEQDNNKSLDRQMIGRTNFVILREL